MGKKHLWFDNIWTVQHKRNGVVIWEDSGRNGLADEGEEAILELYFRNDPVFEPTEFYVRLCNDTLVETDVLGSVANEPTADYGYAPQLLERSTVGFPTKELNEGDWRLVSKEVTFIASGGDIGPVTTAYLATTLDNTGKLLAFRTLSLTRTVLDGDEMVVQMRIKLS